MPAIPSNLMGFETTPLELLTDVITEVGSIKANAHLPLLDLTIDPWQRDQF